MNKRLSITITSILGRPSRSVLLQNNMSSFGLKSSQFISFPISTNLSPNYLVRSYSWRIAKSVRSLMTNYIVKIVFIYYNLIWLFRILTMCHPLSYEDEMRNKRISSKRSPVERHFAFTKRVCKAGHVAVATISKVRVKMIITGIVFDLYHLTSVKSKIQV